MVRHGRKAEVEALAKLGIEGRQPAVAAYVKMSKKEKDRIAESIVVQKAGSNATHIKGYKELVGRRNKEEKRQEGEGDKSGRKREWH